jgi:hypothetical protein
MKRVVYLLTLIAFVLSVSFAVAADQAPAKKADTPKDAAKLVCCKDGKVDAKSADKAACEKAGGKWGDAKDCK